MAKTYKVCQSCGMPHRQDPNGGGTEADGSKNPMYCSYCYEKGEFTQPNFTAEQMQEFCLEKIKEMGMPTFLGKFFVRKIPKLERWKK